MTVNELLESLKQKDIVPMLDRRVSLDLFENEFYKEHKVKIFDNMLSYKGFDDYKRLIYGKLIDYLDTDKFNVVTLPIFRYNNKVDFFDYEGISLDNIVKALSNNKVVILYEPIFRSNEIYFRSKIIG